MTTTENTTTAHQVAHAYTQGRRTYLRCTCGITLSAPRADQAAADHRNHVRFAK